MCTRQVRPRLGLDPILTQAYHELLIDLRRKGHAMGSLRRIGVISAWMFLALGCTVPLDSPDASSDAARAPADGSSSSDSGPIFDAGPNGHDAGASHDAGGSQDAGTGKDANTPPPDAGTVIITTHCTDPLPANAQPANVASPTTVVGDGTTTKCTFGALNAAVTKGGIITFNCGSAPFTIPVTATLNLPTDKDTIIDGANLITLDGGGSVEILRFDHGDFMKNESRVTLQHLAFINAKTNPTQAIPTRPAPCSQGFNDGEGGAIYMNDGNLTVIDCTFSNNQAALLGPDTGGGAIYITGSKHGAIIAGSVFVNNKASNAAAVGGLFAELHIYNSLFKNNTATGSGNNTDNASKCSFINNDQHECGSGGNGGAIYQDGGAATNILLCGVEVVNNAAGDDAFGGGVFMTSNDWTGTLTVKDSTITGNTGGSWTQLQQGSIDLGSAFGVNAKSASVTSSNLQR